MAKVKVKLKKGVPHFYDMATRTSVFPGKEVFVDYSNTQVKEALGSGLLERVPLSPKEKQLSEAEIKAQKDPLWKKTKAEIMEDFNYMEPDDLELLGKLNKVDLILKGRELEDSYDN